MLIDDNKFGAPWNDQFYWVYLKDEDGKQWEELLTLSGPKNYDDIDLLSYAKGMFPNYEIVDIKPYEIF